MTAPPRYPQAHRDAIATAVLDGNMTVRAAIRAAAAGALPNVPAFTINQHAAYRAVHRAREARDNHQARNQPLDAIPDVLRDLLAASVQEARRLEKASKHGDYNADAIRSVVRNIQELHKGLRYSDPTSHDPKTTGKTQPPPAPNTDIKALLQPTNTNTTDTTADTTPPTTDTGQDTGQRPGSVERVSGDAPTQSVPTGH